MTIDPYIINNIISKEFGESRARPIRISMGVMNYNFAYTNKGTDYIIRIAPLGRIKFLELEYVVMKELFSLNCKVPEAITFSNDFEYSYMIYKSLEGTPLSLSNIPTYLQNQLVESIVENINCIASVKKPFPESRLLSRSIETNWLSFLKNTIIQGEYYLNANKQLVKFDIEIAYKFLISKLYLFESTEKRLVWSDISRDNIIVKNGILSGFVDFEGCMYGDPILPLGYLFAIEGNSKFYQDINSEFKKHCAFTEEMILFYCLFRIFRIAEYLALPLPTGITRDSVTKYFKGLSIVMSNLK